MTVRIVIVLLTLAALCGVSHGEERWANFAEDADLRYYLDQKSVTSLPDNVYIFWVKSVAKDRDFFKREFNINNLSYILTNYELDCATSKYRIRGTMMFDKNRKELNKLLPATGESAMEPVPPESMMELAQDEVCSRAPVKPQESEEPAVPKKPSLPAEPAPAAEPPSLQ